MVCRCAPRRNALNVPAADQRWPDVHTDYITTGPCAGVFNPRQADGELQKGRENLAVEVLTRIGALPSYAPLALAPGECQSPHRAQEQQLRKTAGGLIIPDSAKEKPSEGEIVAVGAGARDEDGDRIAMDVKAGDRVLFGKWSGTEVTLDGEELLIMKESDIMGIIA